MKDYWQSLTRREQMLVSAGGMVLLLTILYFLLVRPLFDYRDDSERAMAAAQATFAVVQQRAAELQAISENSRSDGSDRQEAVSLRVAVSDTARRAGVAINRLQPSEDGALTIWAEGLQSVQMYAWLQALAFEHGIGPANVLVQKSTAGNTLRVQLRFEGAGP